MKKVYLQPAIETEEMELECHLMDISKDESGEVLGISGGGALGDDPEEEGFKVLSRILDNNF